MNSSINPATFASTKIGTTSEQQQFLYKLSTLLSQMLSAINAIQSSAPSLTSLGTITGTSNVNANSASVVAVTFSFSTAVTVNVTNLPATGTIVFLSFNNTAGGARVLTVSASTPDSTSYTSIMSHIPTGAQNLLTGWSVSAGTNWFALGITTAGPTLSLLAM